MIPIIDKYKIYRNDALVEIDDYKRKLLLKDRDKKIQKIKLEIEIRNNER